MKSIYRYGKYQIDCKSCSEATTNQYARKHNGLCKRCFESRSDVPKAIQLTMLRMGPTRNERILEHGYMNYAREEDHF